MTRLIWEKRASAAAGNRGLKMEPSGAMTLIGRNDPWFDGTLISEVSASRRSERIAQKQATLVEPSKGTLNPRLDLVRRAGEVHLDAVAPGSARTP